ncbi:MAG: GntR family transcriptional regulator [Xanthomonadales bacterium]|nr:GntR family transcriptional regulator [Xanthomonadales bacterium]
MTHNWNENQPIYWQLCERTIERILEGSLNEADPLPSVRQVAAELQINPITVSKAYQLLVDEGIVEKRRGLGMFVKIGARKQLLLSEREKFRSQIWPDILARMRRLDIDPASLLEPLKKNTHQ